MDSQTKTSTLSNDDIARYKLFFDNAVDAIFLVDGVTFVDCNPATLSMFDCTRDQIIGKSPVRFSPEFQPNGQPSAILAKNRIEAAYAGKKQVFEWVHIDYYGKPIEAEVSLSCLEIGGKPHLQGVVRDISGRKEAESALRKSQIQITETNNNLRTINELAATLFGERSIDAILDTTLETLSAYAVTPHIAIFLLDDIKETLELYRANGFTDAIKLAAKTIPVEGSWSGLAIASNEIIASNDFSNGKTIAKKALSAFVESGINAGYTIPLHTNEETIGCLNICFDNQLEFAHVDRQVLQTIGRYVSLALLHAKNVNQLDYMAYYDSLTGLPNRELLHKTCTAAINAGSMNSGALLLLDLDRFKEINDTLGHYVGDTLLKQIGPRLEKSAQAFPSMVCRLGGDEFALLIYNTNDKDEVLELASAILNNLRQPFSVENLHLEIDGSIGVALFPEHGKDSHELLRSADVAMYEAKTKGEGFALYDQQKDNHTPQRLALSAELGSAIRAGQLILHYQHFVGRQ